MEIEHKRPEIKNVTAGVLNALRAKYNAPNMTQRAAYPKLLAVWEFKHWDINMHAEEFEELPNEILVKVRLIEQNPSLKGEEAKQSAIKITKYKIKQLAQLQSEGNEAK
jgi:hypothetical protein